MQTCATLSKPDVQIICADNLSKPVRINLCKPDVQITYDIYKPYIHKAASSRELLLVSRVSVAFFGLVMACVSVIFYKVLLLSYQSCISMWHSWA